MMCADAHKVKRQTSKGKGRINGEDAYAYTFAVDLGPTPWAYAFNLAFDL